METSIEKSDFQFHGLQKTRLFPSGTVFGICHDAICVSSQYQIAIASSGDNKLVSFNSSAIHTLRVTSQTTNKEFTDLQKKFVELAEEDKITALSLNSSGTLLAVLVNNTAGCFVYIFDAAAFSLKYAGDVYHVASIRLGTEDKAKGACLKWNPALADTLAASADDRSLIVARVDPKNPSSYSLIGSKKMGAIVTHISWSPKGKQLTTGDATGKICQLKMELDVVRGTMPPDFPNTPKEHVAPIVGLCWISTTEWLVAFPGPNADAFVFMLTIKKDQQPSWKLIPELQYGNTQSSVGTFFSFDTSLLLSWNLVLIASAKSSEIVVIGKTDDWKFWNLDDCGRLDLPTDSSTKETFPLGLCVDLSSSTQVILSDDGSKTHRACPIIFALTTDGILTAHNIVSMDSTHTDCTMEPVDVLLSSVKVGKRVAGKPVAPKPAVAAEPPKSLFVNATPAPLVIPTMKSVFGEAPPTPTAAFPPSDAKPFSFGTMQKPLFQPQASSTPLKQAFPVPPVATTAAALMGAATLPAASTSSIPPMSATTTPIKTNVPVPKKEKEDISAEVAAVNRIASEVRDKWNSVVDDLRTISVGLNHTEPLVQEATAAIQSHDALLLKEFSNVIAEADVDYRKMESRIAVLIATMGAKHAKVNLYESDDDRLRALHNWESFDIDEKMKRLTLKLDETHEKYAEIKKEVDNCCRMKKKWGFQKKSSKPIPSLSVGERDYINTQVKVIKKWTTNLKTRVEFIEEDLKTVKLKQRKIARTNQDNVPAPEIQIFENFAAPSVDGLNIQDCRNRLLEFKSVNVPTKKLNPVPFDYKEEKEKKVNAFENLKETLLSSMVNSPQKTIDTTLNVSRSDASTQIDAPPQIKIIEKEVPVPQVVTPNPSQMSVPVPQPSFASLPKPTSPLAVKQEEKPFELSKPVSAVTPVPPKETPKKAEASPAGAVFTSEKKPPLTAKPSLFPEAQAPTASPDLSQKGGLGVPTNLTPKTGTSSTTSVISTPQKPATPLTEEKQTVEIGSSEKITQEKPQEIKSVTPEVKNTFSFSSPSSTSSSAVPTAATPKPSFSFSSSVQNAPSSTSQPTEASTFSFAQKPAETKVDSPKPSIFSSPSTTSTGTVQTPEKKSIFGGGTSTTASIFGGNQQQKSTFGQFPSASPQTSSPSAFSFKPKEAAAPAPSTFTFSQKPSGASSGFLAAAKAAVEDGMMEDETSGQSGGSGFSSFGSMSLGTANSTASKNIFSTQPQQQKGLFSNVQKNPSAFGTFAAAAAQNSAKPSIFGGASQPTQSTGSSIFGGASQSAQTGGSSIFGGASQSGQTGGSIFGGGTQPTQTKSVFGSAFGQAAQQAANSSTNSAFNTTTPKFGAAASFGTKPQNVFGGKPVFANSSPGTGVNPPAGGGFAKYATSGNLFMSNQQQQQQGQNPSIFQFR